MFSWLNNNVVVPMRGLTWAQRLDTLVVGVLGGLFPIPVLTTVATVALCWVLKLTAVQIAVSGAINIAVTPLELLLIPSFSTLGSFACPWVGSGPVDVTALVSLGFSAAIQQAPNVFLSAAIGWVVAVVFALVVRFSVRVIVQPAEARKGKT